MIVEAYEPVAKDARRHGVAVSEVQDGPKVLQKQREECRLVARLLEGREATDVVTGLPQLACLDLLQQVPQVEDDTHLLFRPAMFNQQLHEQRRSRVG